MFCEKCGTQVSDKDIFCPKCGQRQIQTEQQPIKPAPVIMQPINPAPYNYTVKTRVASGWKIALGIVLALISGVVEFIYYAAGEADSYEGWRMYNDLSDNNVGTLAIIGIIIGIAFLVWGIIGEQKVSYSNSTTFSPGVNGMGYDSWKCPQCGRVNAGYRSCGCGYTR